jgi:BlaI family penicillinase repressor
MTMMGILERKGRLKRETVDRAHVYRPAEPQGKVVRGMVQDFLDRVFSGSARPLLVHLLENRDIDREELDELRSLLKDKGRKK